MGKDHLNDENAMALIEKDMLDNIRRKINKPYNWLKTILYTPVASFLIFCLTIFSLKQFTNKSDKLVTITAHQGHIAMALLPDGSTVWLNSGSTLRYSASFGRIRSVELINGEAFFDIKHNETHPFVVHYGNLHAQVLGTSFNIKYYKKLNDVRVTVVTGLVEVGNEHQSFGLISPNKEIIYNQKTSFHKARPVNSQKVAAWKTREINLYDVPFEDLVLTIENTYGIKVKYNYEKMKDVVTTIHFSSSDDIKEALEIIKTIHGLNYAVNGKEVILGNND